MNGKYIDRDEALFELRTGLFPQDVEYTEAIGIAESIIKSAPGVDAVEVVRCKDCVRYGDVSNVCKGRPTEPNLHRKPNDFCSYGVRREENG